MGLSKEQLDRLKARASRAKELCGGELAILVDAVEDKYAMKPQTSYECVNVMVGKMSARKHNFGLDCLQYNTAAKFIDGIEQGCLVREETSNQYRQKLPKTVEGA